MTVTPPQRKNGCGLWLTSIVTGASMGDLEKRWRAASAMMMMMPFTPEHVCRQQCNDDAVMMRV
eukprot:937713-Rhodomonas_salina.1